MTIYAWKRPVPQQLRVTFSFSITLTHNLKSKLRFSSKTPSKLSLAWKLSITDTKLKPMFKRNVFLGDSHHMMAAVPNNTRTAVRRAIALSSLVHVELCGSGPHQGPMVKQILCNRPSQKHCPGSPHNCRNATVTVRKERETHDQEEVRGGESRAFQQLTYFPQVSLQPAHLMI